LFPNTDAPRIAPRRAFSSADFPPPAREITALFRLPFCAPADHVWRHVSKRGTVFSMPARLGLAAACLLATGCETTRSLALDVPAEDLVAVAIVSPGGDTRALVLREDDAPSIELADGDRAYAFTVAHAAFVNLDGSPLPRDAIRGADVHLEGELPIAGKGSCGFCVLPAETPPQRVTPGDSCPLPPFARAIDLLEGGKEIELAPLDELRKRILVDWPGDCP
jgi:hypothetical protein